MKPALKNGALNNLQPEDRPAHDWYRFVLSFPPHLVRTYLSRFGISPGQTVLDPFCGTGTTLVECKKLGVHSIGIEANPVAHFASCVKTSWGVDLDLLQSHATLVAARTRAALEAQKINDDALSVFAPQDVRHIEVPELLDFTQEQRALILRGSISPLPLHKTLTLLATIDECKNDALHDHELLALASAVVNNISNLHFGPEVGVGAPRFDVPVITPWLQRVRSMVNDLRLLHHQEGVSARAHLADAREITQVVEPESVDAVITSPPYPNEKDYTRTTRLEAVLLGYVKDKTQLRSMKQQFLRSNTRNVYAADHDDDWAKDFPTIQALAEQIEARRIELRKTSGFERLYARTTRLYFGGMARHLDSLRTVLKPGAHLAYVVGDQASYLRVMIRTGELLAEIAQSLGYELVAIDLFRTRLATATRDQLREEVVVLRWKG